MNAAAAAAMTAGCVEGGVGGGDSGERGHRFAGLFGGRSDVADVDGVV